MKPKGINDVIDLVVKTYQVARNPDMVAEWENTDVPDSEIWDTFYSCHHQRGAKNRTPMTASELNSFYHAQKQIKTHKQASFSKADSEVFFGKINYTENIDKARKVDYYIRDRENIIDRDPAKYFQNIDLMSSKYKEYKDKAIAYIEDKIPHSCGCDMGFKYYFFKEENISLCVNCTTERLAL